MAENRILKVTSGSSSKGEVRLYELTGNGVHYSSLIGADSISSNALITVPNQTSTLATIDLTETISGNKTYSGTSTFSGIATFSATPYFSLMGPATATTYFLTRGSGGRLTESNIAGTSNQINLSTGAGLLTLSLPQDIHTTATPTFTDISLTNQTGTGNVVREASPTLSGTIGGALSYSSLQTYTNGLKVTGGSGSEAGAIKLDSNFLKIFGGSSGLNLYTSDGSSIFTTGAAGDLALYSSLTSYASGFSVSGSHISALKGLVVGTSGTLTSSASLCNNSNYFEIRGSSSGTKLFANNTTLAVTLTPTLTTVSNKLVLSSMSVDGVEFLGKNYSNEVAQISLQGTSNQVTVTNNLAGTVTLSLPQNIASSSSPSFQNTTLSGTLTYTTPATYCNSFAGRNSSGQLGTVSLVGTSNQVIVSNFSGSAGTVTLSLPQSINSTAAPIFGGLAVTGYITHGSGSSAATLACKVLTGNMVSNTLIIAHGLNKARIKFITGYADVGALRASINCYSPSDGSIYTRWNSTSIIVTSNGSYFASPAVAVYVWYDAS